MGRFKRELTYAGDVSKLTNIQKKRVSSISQEADATTWLGDDVLGAEVIKYDINGYNVNIKKKAKNGVSDILWPIINPFPCKVKVVINNYTPGKQLYTYNSKLITMELYKDAEGVYNATNMWATDFIKPSSSGKGEIELEFKLAPGFNLLRVASPDYSVYLDITYSFTPISFSEYNDFIATLEPDENIYPSNLTFVCNRKSFIEDLGTKDTTYIRLSKLDALTESMVFRYGKGNSLYQFLFVTSGNNKKMKYKYHQYTVMSFDMLYKILSGGAGTGTLILVPYSGKNAILNNWETPTGKSALSWTEYTKDSPEIAKLTELYNSIK